MNCPKCSVAIDSSAAPTPLTARETAIAIVSDWRVWAVSFGTMMLSGMLAGGLGLNSSVSTAGGGAAGGLFIALRMRTLRKCPHCGAIIHVQPSKPA